MRGAGLSFVRSRDVPTESCRRFFRPFPGLGFRTFEKKTQGLRPFDFAQGKLWVAFLRRFAAKAVDCRFSGGGRGGPPRRVAALAKNAKDWHHGLLPRRRCATAPKVLKPSQVANRLDKTGIRYMLLGRANYAFSSFRSSELRQLI
jgi:hypothetical protein